MLCKSFISESGETRWQARKTASIVLVACLWASSAFAQAASATVQGDRVLHRQGGCRHISFVNEARPWFARMAAAHHFSFESTTNWDNLNLEFLRPFQVVVFLDTRPDVPPPA